MKYYMRGLGIGIILTTLILTIGNRTIPDEEVIRRASALGMAFKDEEDDKLNKMLEGKRVTLTPALTPALTAAPSQTPADGSKDGQEEQLTITPAITTAPEPTVVQEPSVTPEADSEREPVAASEAEGEAGNEITFSIERGMSSGQAAEVLKQAGLIQDAEAFNRYVMEEGKAGVIKVGEFKVKKGASYDEIIKIITSE